MKIIYKSDEKFDIKAFPSAVAIGKFDGVHLGHKRLLNVMQPYRERGYKLIALTFDKNPAAFFNNELMQGIITEEEKYEMLFECGMDAVCVYEVNKKSMQTEPVDFVENILLNELNARALCAGFDVSFGNKGKGDYALLEKLSDTYGFSVEGVDKLKTVSGEIISSTFIRSLLKEKAFSMLKEALGYDYFIKGRVLHGKAMGSKIGFPTANINPSAYKLLPENGVYKTRVCIDGKYYQAVSNLGVRPTTDTDGKVNLETHVLDYAGDLYGKELKIEFLVYIRPEKHFNSLDELKKQLQDDIFTCKSL